ncbi:MAG: hypothetical protein ACYC6O_00820 [Thermoleophilia bacterium]
MKIFRRRVLTMAVFMLAALALSAFVFGNGAGASGWFIQTVDYATQEGGDLNELGYDTSLDFGPGDIPHISYYDDGNHDLKYATWEQYAGGGGNWNIQRVDTMGKVGKDTSIDVSGNVYISYFDDTNRDLKFAWKAVGDAAWQYEVADNGGGSQNYDKYDVGEDTSLAVGTDGKPRVSYFSDAYDDLKYAIKVGSGGNCGGGKWQCTTIDSSGKVGKYTSLVLDSSNKAHISYYDDTNGNLKYAYEVAGSGNCGGGNWQCATVDSSSRDVGEHTSIALDMNGFPQIAYEDETWGDLKYACQTTSGWSITVVSGDGSGDIHTGEDTSLAIGADGRPRIAFHNESSEDLDFAIRSDVCGLPGTWDIQHVDTVGKQGEDNSLALKSDDSPCVSYHDETHGNLKYACEANNPPTVSNVLPSDWITSTSTTISADYADNSGTGINVASVAVYLESGKLSGCTATATHVSCPVSGLAQGPHSIIVNVRDNAGSSGSGSGVFSVDSIAPAVSNVQPGGNIAPGSATISAYLNDEGSGINTGSVNITLDGNPVTGCSVTASGVSCPVSGLAPGVHNIGGSASDNAGNTSPISGSFTVVCAAGKPSLALICPDTLGGSGNIQWASYADYTQRKLSITYAISNIGAGTAYSVTITGTSATGGVTLATAVPYGIGNIGGGGSAIVTLKYNVPVGTAQFITNTTASAQDECANNYSYPN